MTTSQELQPLRTKSNKHAEGIHFSNWLANWWPIKSPSGHACLDAMPPQLVTLVSPFMNAGTKICTHLLAVLGPMWSLELTLWRISKSNVLLLSHSLMSDNQQEMCFKYHPNINFRVFLRVLLRPRSCLGATFNALLVAYYAKPSDTQHWVHLPQLCFQVVSSPACLVLWLPWPLPWVQSHLSKRSACQATICTYQAPHMWPEV